MNEKERSYKVVSVHPSIKELLGETRQETGKNLLDITRSDVVNFLLKDYAPSSGLQKTVEYAYVGTCTDEDPSKITRYCNKLQTKRTIEQCKTLCPTDSFRWCPTVAVGELHSEIEKLTRETIDQGAFITDQQGRIEKLEDGRKEDREKIREQKETIKGLEEKIGSLGDLGKFETMSKEVKEAWGQLDLIKKRLGDDPVGRIKNLLSVEAENDRLKEELNRKSGDINTLTREKSLLEREIIRTKETKETERIVERQVPEKDLPTRFEEILKELRDTPGKDMHDLYVLAERAKKMGLIKDVKMCIDGSGFALLRIGEEAKEETI